MNTIVTSTKNDGNEIRELGFNDGKKNGTN